MIASFIKLYNASGTVVQLPASGVDAKHVAAQYLQWSTAVRWRWPGTALLDLESQLIRGKSRRPREWANHNGGYCRRNHAENNDP
jgi:hypothetical protein